MEGPWWFEDRFLKSYMQGYLYGRDNNDDTQQCLEGPVQRLNSLTHKYIGIAAWAQRGHHEESDIYVGIAACWLRKMRPLTDCPMMAAILPIIGWE